MEDKKFMAVGFFFFGGLFFVCLGFLSNPSCNYLSLHDYATWYRWDFHWELP